MPLTDEELRGNYYLACVAYLCGYGGSPYTANDPSTGGPWAFALADNGGLPHPQPYVLSWGVASHAQPTSDQLAASCDMTMIAACQAALYPPAALEAEGKLLRGLVAGLAARVADLSAALAASRPPAPEPSPADSPAPEPEPPAREPSPAPEPTSPPPGIELSSPLPAERRDSLDELGFELLEAHDG